MLDWLLPTAFFAHVTLVISVVLFLLAAYGIAFLLWRMLMLERGLWVAGSATAIAIVWLSLAWPLETCEALAKTAKEQHEADVRSIDSLRGSITAQNTAIESLKKERNAALALGKKRLAAAKANTKAIEAKWRAVLDQKPILTPEENCKAALEFRP